MLGVVLCRAYRLPTIVMTVAGQLWRAATREALRGSVARTGLRQATTAASAQGAGAGRVALVQGASRGLGLEFVRQLLERPDHRCQALLWCVTCACTIPAANHHRSTQMTQNSHVASCSSASTRWQWRDWLQMRVVHACLCSSADL